MTDQEMTETEMTEMDTEQHYTPLTAPLSSLYLEHKCWANPRSILDDGKLEELALSIKDKGILTPLHVARLLQNGSIIHLVLDGQRRVIAGNRVLDKDYPVPIVYAWPEVIEELDWTKSDELLKIALDIGNRREALTSYELVETGERLKNRNKSNADIARALNRSETWVSRMLKARLNATPKLMASWKRGDLSDEQFKDLAGEKDPEKQVEAAREVVAARAGGDKAGARMKAKEIQAAAKQREAPAKAKASPKGAKATKASGKAAPVVSGPQADLPLSPPVKRSMVSRVVLEDMLGLAAKVPPVHDYVRGLFHAVAYVMGDMDPADFSKPWHQYLARHGDAGTVGGAGKADKPSRAKRIAKAAKRRGKGKGK